LLSSDLFADPIPRFPFDAALVANAGNETSDFGLACGQEPFPSIIISVRRPFPDIILGFAAFFLANASRPAIGRPEYRRKWRHDEVLSTRQLVFLNRLQRPLLGLPAPIGILRKVQNKCKKASPAQPLGLCLAASPGNLAQAPWAIFSPS
jgi:hypothetical protein